MRQKADSRMADSDNSIQEIREPTNVFQISLPNTDLKRQDIVKVRRLSHKRANQLDGKTWTRFSISVWSDIRKTTEEATVMLDSFIGLRTDHV